MPRVAFDSFSVDAPHGWEDITDSVEADSPPFTLARSDGVGALQFSIALYMSGRVPDPSLDDLAARLKSFGQAHGVGEPFNSALESEPLRLAAGTFAYGDDFLRAWQVSDGRSFAFITYICESGQEDRELAECEQIVRSLRWSRP